MEFIISVAFLDTRVIVMLRQGVPRIGIKSRELCGQLTGRTNLRECFRRGFPGRLLLDPVEVSFDFLRHQSAALFKEVIVGGNLAVEK